MKPYNRKKIVVLVLIASALLPGIAAASMACAGTIGADALPKNPAAASRASAAAMVPAIAGSSSAAEMSNSAAEWKKLIATPPQGKESFATRQQAVAALLAAKRAGHLAALPPIAGTNGAILYPYGQSWPTVVASPLHITVIALGKGDKPGQVVIGAPGEWEVTQAMAGERPLIAVTPRFVGLHTNLMITATSAGGHARIYYVNLASDNNQYVPRVGFYYPERQETQWKLHTQATAAQKSAVEQQTVASMPTVNPTDLNYGWNIHCGAGGWFSASDCGGIRPTQVFSDNRQVFIKMKPHVADKTLPTVISYNLDDQPAIINYRFKNGYYIVDGVPHEIDLVLGTGSNAKVVTIKQKR